MKDRGVSRLPPFYVVVWVKKTDDFPELRDALIGLAADAPDESTEDEGMVFFVGASTVLKKPRASQRP